MEDKLLKNIWIIDDSPIDAFLMQSILVSLNYGGNISPYSNPIEAFNLYKKFSHKNQTENIPDVIFLDLNMPQMHGFDFIEILSTQNILLPKTKIIIVTSSDDPIDIERSSNYENVIDFIIKPVQKMDFFVKESLLKACG